MKKTILFLIISSLILTSCATTGRGSDKEEEKGLPLRENKKEIREIQDLLKEASYKYAGKKSLKVRGKSFRTDCSGVVAALYYYAGIDLQKHYPEYSGSGTERIYKMLEERGLLEKSWLPETGDIIFWDNTYDKNNNGKSDDLLTHIGMVVERDKYGNIEYIHHNYLKGIVIEKMNIRYKNEHTRSRKGIITIINSPMRKKGGTRIRDKWLSGQLYNSSAPGYLMY